jgi:hypothetical protein
MYLQALLQDLDFYDHHFQPGAYLRTHAEHKALWHPGEKGQGDAEKEWKEELEKIKETIKNLIIFPNIIKY